jgi:hypothetical protein
MVKLESYPAILFSAQVDTLPSVIVELLKVVADLLSKVWDVATGLLSGAKDTILSTGAGLGSTLTGGAKTVIGKGTGIVLSKIGAIPGVLAVPVAVTSTKRVTLIGAPSATGKFAVGGIYTLQPENGTLSKPASLTLSYAAAALGKVDPASLSVYHYDAPARTWTPVPSTHDQAARELTAQITQLGGYCIGSDAESPSFELLLPSGTPPVVTTSLPELTLTCRDTGSGIVPSTFAASIDGNPVQADWSTVALQGTLTVVDPLVDGSHKLVVQATDGSGNKGSATFDVQVRQAPAPPVVRLDAVSTGKVQLGLEAGAGGGQPTSFVLWRSEPEVGPVYHRMGTVKAGAGTYVDKDVRSGATYLYAATALASADTEGPMSEPLQVVIPGVPGGQEGSGEQEQSARLPLALVLGVLAALAVLVGASLAVVVVLRKGRRPPGR